MAVSEAEALCAVTPQPQPAMIAGALLPWWDTHGRKDLPWQKEPTLYRVWVSEIMLQQTQVITVARYYERFLGAFPDVVALADASADAVLHFWSGLGYYSRARNLHRAARQVRDDFGGVIPRDFADLLSLPGIGRSTAGAILALATGQRHAILDGNVRRVLSRVFGVESAPEDPATQRRLWQITQAATPEQRTASYTQAIMDLGATVCTRRRPACTRCPLAGICAAHHAGNAERLPAARARRARPLKSTVVLLACDDTGRVLLEKRAENGLWGGLWGLPEVATVEAAIAWCHAQFGRPPVASRKLAGFRHAFTHFDLDITPLVVKIGAVSRAMEDGRWLWYNMRDPARVGLSAPVMKLFGAAQAAVDTWREP